MAQGELPAARRTPRWWHWFWGPGRRRQWRRLVLRRVLAAGCGAGAVLGVLAVARAHQQVPTRAVVVAARAVAVGQVVDAGSVRVARWPAELVPVGALSSLVEAVGRPAGTPIGAGEPVTAARLSASALLAGQPTGTVAVHVPLLDGGAAAMLEAGEQVDLLGPAGPVARGLTVLRVDGRDAPDPASAGGLGGGLGGGGLANTTDTGAGMVVAADEPAAAALAAAPLDALGRPSLTVVLRAR